QCRGWVSLTSSLPRSQALGRERERQTSCRCVGRAFAQIRDGGSSVIERPAGVRQRPPRTGVFLRRRRGKGSIGTVVFLGPRFYGTGTPAPPRVGERANIIRAARSGAPPAEPCRGRSFGDWPVLGGSVYDAGLMPTRPDHATRILDIGQC